MERQKRMDDATLKRIDAKLSAILAIQLDQYLRETGVARPKPRSIDRLLTDVGLPAREIAALLGKTERAVHMVLAGERDAKATRGQKKSATPDEVPAESGEVA
jgi:hypothetical protein